MAYPFFGKAHHPAPRRIRPALEALEDRLAPALINWVNRADFTNQYDGNTMIARQVIDRAIMEWESVIESFNYRHVGKKGWAPRSSFDVRFVVGDLGDTLGLTSTNDKDLDGDGKPFQGYITLDDDAITSNPRDNDGWYFDKNAGDDFEYKSPLTPFAATGGPAGYDLYSVVLHELGHALGFRYTANSNIQGRITNNPVPPPDKIFHFLDGSTIFMTTEGGLHLWDGTHANDLMSPDTPSNYRNAISDLDARILADSYGYTINWGYLGFRSFITTFDTSTRELKVWGDLGTTSEPIRVFDDVKLDVFTGGFIFVDVNGLIKRVDQPSVGNIFIATRQGNDAIRIGGTAARQTVEVQAGAGDNTVFLSHSAQNLDTIQGDVYVVEGNGRTNLILQDEKSTAPRTFSALGTNVNFTGSAANIRYRYTNTASNLDSMVLRGGDKGNIFNINDSPASSTAFLIIPGKGKNTLNLQATVGSVNVAGNGGRDTVTVGVSFNSGLRDINGLIYISNTAQLTNVILDDSGDPNPNPNIQITDTSVTGLGPAGIYFEKGKLASLTVRTGTNTDAVVVGASPNGLAGIPPLRLEDAGGTDSLLIKSDTVILDYNRDVLGVPNTSEGRLTNYPLSFAGFENLTLESITPNSTATLLANPRGVSTTVRAFGKVNLGKGNGTNIRGIVRIASFFSPTELTFDDSAATTPRTIEVDANSVSGLGSENPIDFSLALISMLTVSGGLGGPNQDGAPQGNTVILHNTRFANQLSSVVLNAGAGPNGDNVYIHRSNTSVTVNGQTGLDNVYIGLDGSTEDIDGLLYVTNFGSWTALHIDDSASNDAKVITLNNPNGLNGNGSIVGLTSFPITYRQRDFRELEIVAGSGNNQFDVLNTPQSTFAGGLTTNIKTTGVGSDTFNVQGTKGALAIDAQQGFNQFMVGTPTAGLDRINGAIDVRGSGGANYLRVNDAASTTTHGYVLDRNLVQRTDKPPISYQDLTSLEVTAGAVYDQISILDTPPTVVTSVNTGGGDDYIPVTRTTGDLFLTAGGASYIEVGNNVTSLDAIQGRISIYPVGGNSMTLRLVDTAATALQTLTADANVFGQTYLRSGAAAITAYFSPVVNVEYIGGSGGTTAFINGTAAGTTTSLYGHAGAFDIFALGFGTDLTKLLGTVLSYGQAVDNDFAYYYEYLNPNPQTYTISTNPSSGTMLIQRQGIASMQFGGLGGVSFYAPVIGNNDVRVRSTPAGTQLGLVAGNGDRITLGSNAPNLGGSLAGILAPVVVVGYGDADVRMVVDNSGDLSTGSRRITLRERQGQYDVGHHIEGFAPAAISWDLRGASTLTLLGGAADETFALRNTEFGIPVTIHGGGGVNALDFSEVPGVAGQVSWYQAEGNAVDAVGGSHGTLQNGTTFAPGRVGQAFSFDGVDDFVEVVDSPLHSPSSITLEAWVKPDTVAGTHFILTKYDSSQPNNLSWALGSLDGRVRFGVYQGAVGRVIDTNSPVLTAGVWQHVAATFDVATQAITIYVNGTLVPSSFVPGNDVTITAITDSNSPVRIGSIVNSSGEMVYFWDGGIDDVSIFNRALSAAEVRSRFVEAADGMPPTGPGVYVNLRTGQATGLAGGIANIQNVIGSAANDILVGIGGNFLFGGAGRDLLIAGITESQLFGGGDEDLLIGGTTAHDTNRAALDQIMAVWTSAADYETRVANLRAGLLGADSVFSNGLMNTLNGEGGRDVFFGNLFDLLDRQEDEVLVEI